MNMREKLVKKKNLRNCNVRLGESGFDKGVWRK